MSAKDNKTTTSEDTDSVEDEVVVVEGGDDMSSFQENSTPDSKFRGKKRQKTSDVWHYGSLLTYRLQIMGICMHSVSYVCANTKIQMVPALKKNI